MSNIVSEIKEKSIFSMRLIFIGDSFGTAKGTGAWTLMSNLLPLKIIDGVNVGWTELGKKFIYCIIPVKNCPYSLFGSLKSSIYCLNISL